MMTLKLYLMTVDYFVASKCPPVPMDVPIKPTMKLFSLLSITLF
jgi:hypothetical protein